MNSLLSRFTIARQVSLIGSIGIVGLVLVGAIYLWGQSRQSATQDVMESATRGQLAANEFGNGMLLARRAEKDFLLRHQERYVEQHGKGHE
jgi:methyl-accepting chemotaxis protein